MYIEMTTFAVPTFLITLLQVACMFVIVWTVFFVIVLWLYNRSLRKGIERNAEKCDKRMRGERIL